MPPTPPAQAPQQIAEQFVKRYYDVLTSKPQLMNRFYKDESRWSLAVMRVDGEPAAPIQTQGPTVSAGEPPITRCCHDELVPACH